jgi:pyruvate dehydrogenase (quinone)
MMQEADTLLMVGSSFPYSNFLPPVGQARGVQIDIAARMLSLCYPMEVNLCGDSRATLRELMPLLHRKEDRSFQERIEKEVAEWWRLMEQRAAPEDHDGRIRPQALFDAISRRLPDDAVLTADSGSAANWFARHIRTRRGMKATLSGNLATMLPGVPYAIAAKFAFPDRLAVAMVGDGAMQMGGMAEMLTAAKYHTSWADPRLVVLVLNNGDLNQVTWEQRVLAGDPRFDASQLIPSIRFDEYARLIGLDGIRVERSADIDSAMDRAFAAGRPVIVDAVTDPDEAPLPPHITLKQARSYARSVLKEPGAVPAALHAVREKVDELVPGR